MRFKDYVTDKENHFSLGIDQQTGEYYLSIPVSNGLVDYEEYYRITTLEFDEFQQNEAAANNFLRRCRNHEEDSRLIVKPGTNRGVPV